MKSFYWMLFCWLFICWKSSIYPVYIYLNVHTSHYNLFPKYRMVYGRYEKHIPLSWGNPQSVLWSDSDRVQTFSLKLFCLLLLFWDICGNEWGNRKVFDGYTIMWTHLIYWHFFIVNFLLDTMFSHYKYFCVTLHLSSWTCATPCSMVLPTDFLRDDTYKLT